MDLDELDIYDDLDTFEKEEEKKSAELLTLEEKYKESLKANETLQTENADLKKQIKRIGINFQNLLDTAKAEIKRKDKQIEQLRKENDDICFRRKQPRTDYREANPFSKNIENRHKWADEGYATTEVYKAAEVDIDNRNITSLHTGHARDPRMREEPQKYAQKEEKPQERKHDEKAGSQHNAHRDAHEPTRYEGQYRRERGESSRDRSRDSRTVERGHREDREHSHREYQMRREERERKNEKDYRSLERDYRSERDNKHTRNCSNEKEKYMSSGNKNEESGGRRHFHDKYGDRTSSKQQEKSRSNVFNGNGEKRNECKKTHEDVYKRSKDTDDKVPNKNTTDKRTKNYNGVHPNKDESKYDNVKQNTDSLQSGDVDEYSGVAKKSKIIEAANDISQAINKNGLTKEKLLALEDQFSGKEIIDKNSIGTLPLAGGGVGMITPKKAALFDSIFGTTPINAEKVNNTLLSNVMVLLKNSTGSATTSPSNYTDTDTEQLTSKSTENKLEKTSDIDECFVLKGCSERKLEKDSQRLGNKPLNGDLTVNSNINENKNEKPIADVVKDVISATISLISDDEDKSEVEEITEKCTITAINGALCNQESQASAQGLESEQVIGDTNNGKIKILENIRLPNIYELRAQQRRLREEAAKNKINKILKCKEKPLPKLVEKHKEIDNVTGKAVEVKDQNKSCDTQAQIGKDGNLQNNSSKHSDKKAFTIGSEKENKGMSIEENQIENINAVDTLNIKPVLLIEATGSRKAEAGAISVPEPKSDELPEDLENPMEKSVEPEAAITEELEENNTEKQISVNKPNADAQKKSDFSEESNISNSMDAEPGNIEKQKSMNGKKLEMQVELPVENGVEGAAENTTTTTVTNIASEVAEIAALMETNDQPTADKKLSPMSNGNKNDKLSLKVATENKTVIVIDVDDEATNTESQSKNMSEINNIPKMVGNIDEDTKEVINTITNNNNKNGKKKETMFDGSKEKAEQRAADKQETGDVSISSGKISAACNSMLDKNGILSANIIDDFDVQTIMEDNEIPDTKSSLVNNEKSKLEDNHRTQDTDPNSVERELEDAVAYLVKSMDVGNIYCLDAGTELQSEVYKAPVEINESKHEEVHSKANKCDVDDSNDNKKLKTETQQLANIEKEELCRKESLKPSNNTISELSQGMCSELSQSVDPKFTKILSNADVELSNNTNLELPQKSNLELSKSSDLKLSKNDSEKILPNAGEELSKPPNLELSIPKLPPSSTLLTSQRNVLVDNMKRSEILWKFKIPKISAKRKRETADETSIEKGEIIEETGEKTATHSSSTTANKREQEKMTHQKQQNHQQYVGTNEKNSMKEETSFKGQKLCLIQNEIEIVDIDEEIDTELIETRLLNAQTPEEKRTLSADREKSERIIKEIDNWARRKVGEIPDIIEDSLLMGEQESAETITKPSDVEENKNTNNLSKKEGEKGKESKSLDSLKTQKSEHKTTLKFNGGREYAPLSTLQLCEQHEKENEKQFENGAAGKLEDLKSVKSHKKVCEIHTKNKTDTQKSATERKCELRSDETKAQKFAASNTRDSIKELIESSIKNHEKNLEKPELEAGNKFEEINVEESSKQVVIEEQILKKEKKKIAISNGGSSLEVNENLSEKNPMKKDKVNDKVTGKLETAEPVDKTQKEESPTEGVKNKVKIADTKEEVSVKSQEEIKAATNEILKHTERKGRDKHANVGLKRAGEDSKTKTGRADKEEVDLLQEKRTKLEVDTKIQRENKSHKDNRKTQVPLNKTTTTKDANSVSPQTANSLTKLPNHSTTAAKVDKQKVPRKRQRSTRESEVNEGECEDLMPQTRKRRKRCEMRIEDDDSDEEECVMIKAADTIREVAADSSTGRKDILAILQNDSGSVSELLTTAGDRDTSGCGVGSLFPAPQTPSSLPADISQDEQYREIDSRMQLMFASPKVNDKTASINLNAKSVVGKPVGEPRRQLMEAEGAEVAQAVTKSTKTSSASTSSAPSTPVKTALPPIADTPCPPSTLDFNVSDTSLSDFNSNSFQVSSRNITIDETNYNDMDTSMNSSSFSDNSLSTKHISLGSSDYRFEKVSDNVVNLFITRKRRGKRKPISAAAVADAAGTTTLATAAATVTTINTIKTAT